MNEVAVALAALTYRVFIRVVPRNSFRPLQGWKLYFFAGRFLVVARGKVFGARRTRMEEKINRLKQEAAELIRQQVKNLSELNDIRVK